MPGLENLRVSLTKYGIYRIATVIHEFPASEVIANLSSQSLDEGHVRNILSADRDGKLPQIWDDVRALGLDAINALVFIAIIFSHVKLIRIMAQSKRAEMQGVLNRHDFEDDKAYTNVVSSMETMSLCIKKKGAEETPYNLAPIFQQFNIGPLAKTLLHLKLKATGWEEPRPDEYFKRDFYEQCFNFGFHESLAISQNQLKDWLEGKHVEYEKPALAEIPATKIEVSISLVAALTSKPFVIMSGPTGTGKTVTARHLAKALKPVGVEDSFNHVFIPVEAGWTDSRHLLGYKNPFGKSGETYSSTPLIQLLLRANYPGYSKIPFFVILDEMNLSHVEMYFSRFLSLMETTVSAPISLLDKYELELLHLACMGDPIVSNYTKSALEKGGLFLSQNVFIIGTVNIDETTHMFSPKVLDRAFVIECPSTQPSVVGDVFSIAEQDKLTVDSNALTELMLSDRNGRKDLSLDGKLDELYSKLGRYKFGPRVTTECRTYIKTCKELSVRGVAPKDYASDENILDRLAMQKLLPKLHGNKGQIFSVLTDLEAYCKTNMPASTVKLETMQTGLRNLGFTNFFV